MKTVKLIGVPEHFNFPWHLAIEEGAFAERGIDLQWTDIHEGTGRMAQMLEDNETDLAIILTEGIVKSISEGNPSKIVQVYVESSLQWGIHVAATSNYKAVAELKNKKAAISRFGSGSHLMAFVNAENHGWSTDALQFEVVHNLDNAVQVLQSGKADYFMWELFTTKPLVDSGVFRRVGVCPTPWPCFVIAATQKFLSESSSTLKHLMEVINAYTAEFKLIPSIDRTLANRYQQRLEDIQQWLSMTRWGQEQLPPELLETVQKRLLDLKLIPKTKSNEHILHS